MYEQLYEIYTDSFDFCRKFEDRFNSFLKKSGIKQRNRKSRLELCELLTIQIWFYHSRYRDFKSYYNHYVLKEFKDCFFLVKYSQFVKLINQTPFLLELFMRYKKKKEGKYFLIDSTPLSGFIATW